MNAPRGGPPFPGGSGHMAKKAKLDNPEGQHGDIKSNIPGGPPQVLPNPAEMDIDSDCDWGDEFEEMELANFTQKFFENNESLPEAEPDPWVLTEANDAKNAVADRIESQDIMRENVPQLKAKLTIVDQKNQELTTENFKYKGEITLLRRELNRLTTSKQLEMLNKMKEIRTKDQEKEVAKKENAELVAIKTRLKFALIENETLKQKSKTPANSSAVGRKCSSDVNKHQPKSPAWLSQGMRKSLPVKASSEVSMRATQTHTKDFENVVNRGDEILDKSVAIRQTLIDLVKIVFSSVPDEKETFEKANHKSGSKLDTWRFIDRNSILNTIKDYLSKCDLFSEPDPIEQPRSSHPNNVETELNLEIMKRTGATYLHVTGVWRVITFLGYEINKVLNQWILRKCAPTRTSVVLKIIKLIEHLMWAVSADGRDSTVDVEWRNQISEMVFHLVETLWTSLQKRGFSSIRLQSLGILNSVLLQDIYQPIESNYDHLVEIILDAIIRRGQLCTDNILWIIGILNSLTMMKSERIFEYLCVTQNRTGESKMCPVQSLANVIFEVFQSEKIVPRKLKIFESYTELARNLNRTIVANLPSINREERFSDDTLCSTPPWLASIHWEDKASPQLRCQCRKSFCAIGFHMVEAVWKMWAVQVAIPLGVLQEVEDEITPTEMKHSGNGNSQKLKNSDDKFPKQTKLKATKLKSHIMDTKSFMFHKLSYLSDYLHSTYSTRNKQMADHPNSKEIMSRIQIKNARCQELTIKKLKEMIFEKYLTNEEKRWKLNLETSPDSHSLDRSIFERRHDIDEELLQGILFVDSVSEDTKSLSLAFGTFGFIPLMTVISLYEKFCFEIPTIMQMVGGDNVHFLTLLDPTEDGGTMVERFEYPTNVPTKMQEYTFDTDGISSSVQESEEIEEVKIPSFKDSDWPPKIGLIQESVANPEFNVTLTDIDDELNFPNMADMALEDN